MSRDSKRLIKALESEFDVHSYSGRGMMYHGIFLDMYCNHGFKIQFSGESYAI